MTPKIKYTEIKPVPSNISPEELVRMVEYLYPNLKGPLLSMVKMFDGMIDELDMMRRQIVQYQRQEDHEVILLQEDGEPKVVELKCAHCGQEIEIELS